MDSRKKVQFYLYPEQKSQDAVAMEHSTNLPSGLRSQFYRNSILAGVALSHVDPRLIELLAASLTENLDKNEVIGLIHSITLKANKGINDTKPLTGSDSSTTHHQIENERVSIEPKADTAKHGKELAPDELRAIQSNFAV